MGQQVLNAGAHQRAVTKDSIHGTELSLNFKDLYQPKVDCDNSDAQQRSRTEELVDDNDRRLSQRTALKVVAKE